MRSTCAAAPSVHTPLCMRQAALVTFGSLLRRKNTLSALLCTQAPSVGALTSSCGGRSHHPVASLEATLTGGSGRSSALRSAGAAWAARHGAGMLPSAKRSKTVDAGAKRARNDRVSINRLLPFSRSTAAAAVGRRAACVKALAAALCITLA